MIHGIVVVRARSLKTHVSRHRVVAIAVVLPLLTGAGGLPRVVATTIPTVCESVELPEIIDLGDITSTGESGR